MAGWRRTFHGPGSAPGRGGGARRTARRRWGASAALLLAAAGLAWTQADPAAAAPADGAGIITIYHSPAIHLSTSPESDNGITGGPDGAVWFTNPGNNTIGRINVVGRVRDFAGKGIGNTWVITTGPDGALWAGNWDTHSISRITTRGVVTTFPGTANTPTGIAASSRYLWYTNWAAPATIRRISTAGTSTSFTADGVVYPQSITEGSDGAMWFTDGGVPGADYSIGRITQSGHFTFYSLANYPGSIAAGPDGALWFTYPANNAIGRITTKGVLTSFTAPGLMNPGQVAAGPDGALWFTESNAIGRITTNGHVTSYPVAGLGTGTGQDDIAAGPDGAMWFTNPATNTIGRITTSVTPEIYGKNPSRGGPGTQVTITGRNLAHATQVSFHGVPATIVSDAATYVVAIVPPGAKTGRITVTTPAGTAAKNGWFVVT
jgi:virginiamycin B lyase